MCPAYRRPLSHYLWADLVPIRAIDLKFRLAVVASKATPSSQVLSIGIGQWNLAIPVRATPSNRSFRRPAAKSPVTFPRLRRPTPTAPSIRPRATHTSIRWYFFVGWPEMRTVGGGQISFQSADKLKIKLKPLQELVGHMGTHSFTCHRYRRHCAITPSRNWYLLDLSTLEE